MPKNRKGIKFIYAQKYKNKKDRWYDNLIRNLKEAYIVEGEYRGNKWNNENKSESRKFSEWSTHKNVNIYEEIST